MPTVPACPTSGSKNLLINNNKFRKTSSTVQFCGTPNNSASEQSRLSGPTEHLMPTTTGQEEDLGVLNLSTAGNSGSRVVGCGLADFFQSAFMATVKIMSWPAKAVNRVAAEFRKEQAAAEFREKQRTINMAKKTMTMDEIYKTLHEKGITGKGIQVSVLDGGIDLPEESFRNEFLKMMLPGNQHQAYVSNLIKDAAPDAQVHVLPATSHLEKTQTDQELKKLFRAAFQQPDSLTLQKLREAKMPVIQDLASKIRKEIDNGTKVINLSLSIDKGIYMTLLREIDRATKKYQEKSNLPKDDLEKGKAYLKQLNQLMNQWKRGYQSRNCNDLYKPWWDALDYAYDNGVLIVKSSGNFGKIASGNYIDPMTSKKHPALLVVGSTNEEGVISNFSSVYAHEDIQPDIAANGCGELFASHTQETDLWYLKPLQYLLQRDKLIQHGTSFSAPDLTSLYVTGSLF